MAAFASDLTWRRRGLATAVAATFKPLPDGISTATTNARLSADPVVLNPGKIGRVIWMAAGEGGASEVCGGGQHGQHSVGEAI